jgi:hypothetical protein
LYRGRVRLTHRTRLRGQQDRPPRLRRRISTRPDPAIQHELAHTEREKLRRLVSALSTFHVPELESRLLNRPEGKHNNRCAFPQFLTAGFTNRGPFPERKAF